jgi:hypothetical protein
MIFEKIYNFHDSMKFTSPIVNRFLDAHKYSIFKCKLAVIKSFEMEEIQQVWADCTVILIIFGNKYVHEKRAIVSFI